MTLTILTIIAVLFAMGGLVILAAQPLGLSPEGSAELKRLYRVQVLIIVPPLLFAVLPFWLAGCVLIAAAVRGIWELEGIGGTKSPPWIAHLIFLAALAGLAFLHRLPEGAAQLIFTYAVVESADSFALLFGKLFGRHHPFPHLSPGKTVEGLIGGLAAGSLVGLVIGLWALGWTAGQTVIAGAAVLCGGFAGDWITSAFKRAHARKDFPPLHMLHGGMLDIYDSFLGAGLALSLIRLL